MNPLQRKHSFDPVHGAQEMFRILLEALANPGRILDFSPQAARFTEGGRWLAPALTLLDAETGFFWDGDPSAGEEIRFLTGAPQVPLKKADFVFLSRKEGGSLPPGAHAVAPHPPLRGPAPATPPPLAPPGSPDAARRILAQVKQGTHLDPHNSALLFIDAGEEEENGNPGETLALTGPGIPPEGRTIRLSPAEAAWRRARDEQGFEYPCGVELVFLREDCSLLAIPRKTAFLRYRCQSPQWG